MFVFLSFQHIERSKISTSGKMQVFNYVYRLPNAALVFHLFSLIFFKSNRNADIISLSRLWFLLSVNKIYVISRLFFFSSVVCG